jgi:hypothetical protein
MKPERVKACSAGCRYEVTPLNFNWPFSLSRYLLTYSLRGTTVLVELWPPHIFYVRFRDSKFLQGGIVSPTPNPQTGGPGYLSLSGTSLETGMGGSTSSYAAAGIGLEFIVVHKLLSAFDKVVIPSTGILTVRSSRTVRHPCLCDAENIEMKF